MNNFLHLFERAGNGKSSNLFLYLICLANKEIGSLQKTLAMAFLYPPRHVFQRAHTLPVIEKCFQPFSSIFNLVLRSSLCMCAFYRYRSGKQVPPTLIRSRTSMRLRTFFSAVSPPFKEQIF